MTAGPSLVRIPKYRIVAVLLLVDVITNARPRFLPEILTTFLFQFSLSCQAKRYDLCDATTHSSGRGRILRRHSANEKQRFRPGLLRNASWNAITMVGPICVLPFECATPCSLATRAGVFSRRPTGRGFIRGPGHAHFIFQGWMDCGAQGGEGGLPLARRAAFCREQARRGCGVG